MLPTKLIIERGNPQLIRMGSDSAVVKICTLTAVWNQAVINVSIFFVIAFCIISWLYSGNDGWSCEYGEKNV